MRRLLVFVLTLWLIVPAAVADQAVPSQPVDVDRIVAVVNDEAITLFELRSREAMVERQLHRQNVPLPPAKVLERQVLERMILDRVQMQFAKEIGLHVSDGELDAAIGRIAERNHLSVGGFKAALERDNVAWPKFREEIRQEMTISRLREREVDNHITISQAEIDNYLDNASRGNEEIVQVAHIVVRVPEQADAAQLERSRERIEKAVRELQSGADFGSVAASFSDAPDGLAGGVMEARPVDRLPGLYADAIKNLKPGEISPILRSPAGFHVVKVIERHGAMLPTEPLKQTHVRQILIRVNEVVSDDEARHKLEELKERLDHGADFAKLARLYSNDLSAAKGGDLGWVYQGDTVPEFERAMDALKVGEISQPIRSPFGWHLIQVLGRRTQDASPDRMRLIARQALRARKSDEAYQDWLRQIRDRAYVEVRLEDK
jgi:peptidyl-prolyl cis-trans isomerase SurA